MQIEVCKSKIHKVTVTEANLQYVGSITIDEDLMDAVVVVHRPLVMFEATAADSVKHKGRICLFATNQAGAKVHPQDVPTVAVQHLGPPS